MIIDIPDDIIAKFIKCERVYADADRMMGQAMRLDWQSEEPDLHGDKVRALHEEARLMRNAAGDAMKRAESDRVRCWREIRVAILTWAKDKL